MSAGPLDPLVPRPIDLPTVVPLEPGADLRVLDDAKILAAPDDPADWDSWRAALARWREEARGRLPDHTARYDDPAGAWASGCRVIAQVWLWDELLYDFTGRRFTPDRLVADARERFGGLDAVVLWHAYPVIGLDERNQWDFYREVPGLEELVDTLHDLGLRVFCDYNPWDTGTRRGGSDAAELSSLIADFGFDGVFLDTLRQADAGLIAPLDSARPGLALETESKLALTELGTHTLSWAQWFADSAVPGVLKTHFYEPRHLQHHVRRWNRDHSEELQSAWLNGAGVMVWEVVFSAWVGWNARDAATLRRMRPVQREWAGLLASGRYTPLVRLSGTAHAAGVYAVLWEEAVRNLPVGQSAHPAESGGSPASKGDSATGARLLALVNRSAVNAWLTPADLGPAGEGWCLATGRPSSEGVLVPARGVGGVVSGPGARELAEASAAAPTDASPAFPYREFDRIATSDPRGHLDHPPAGHSHLPSVRSHTPTSHPSAGDLQATPAGPPAAPASGPDFVRLPAGRYHLTVRYRCRETGLYGEAPFVEEWKPLHPRLHDLRTREFTVDLGGVAVADREVTAAEFTAFVAATGHPWTGPSEESGPATWVSLEDARAYCSWRGGRLPTEFEWQLAAARTEVGTASVQAVTSRDSGPGVDGVAAVPDSVHVWNWTESEYSDGRSRFCILKGGSDCAVIGSEWYVDAGPHTPDWSLKYLRKGFDLDRNRWTGFRIAFAEGE